MAPKKWSYLEIGIVAYVIYSCIGATIGGIMFLLGGSIMTSMQNSATQQGLGLNAPHIGQMVQVVGGVLLAVGLIGGAASAIYIANRKSSPGAPAVDDSDKNDEVDSSNLRAALVGAVAADVVASRRRRRFINGFGPNGMGPGGLGGRPPGA